MESIAHVEDDKKELVKDVHRLSRLVIWLVDSSSRSVSVHPSSASSLVVEVKEGQHHDLLFIELKD